MNRPDVIAMRRRVEISADAEIRKLESHLRIALIDGRVLERQDPHALGTLERPMSDRDLEAKFRGLCEGRYAAGDGSNITRILAM